MSTKARNPIFYTIAICLPFLVLLAIEGLLRITGVGKTFPLFVPAPNLPHYLQANPEVIQRFFHKPSLAPKVSPDTFIFKAEKPNTSMRILMMGGSTMAGFPYGRFGSPSASLHQHLKKHYPERNIEIISVAMASINSYALLDFTQEIIDIQADAVFIYAGHNEYLGIMGVGSNFASKGGHGANLLFLALKNIRLFQLMQNVFHTFSDTPKVDYQSADRTVMASVAKEKSIPFESSLYQAGLEQFTQNLDTILRTFSEHNIPVFLSNIVSNEKDQAPFESMNTAQDISSMDALTSNNSKNAYQNIKLTFETSSKSADLAYKLAEKSLIHDKKQSVYLFQTARDLDELRFRAPTQFNQVISGLSSQYDNVNYVDTESYLRAHSNQGIIGSTIMLEHLHPTRYGYALIGDAFFNALNKSGVLFNHFESSPVASEMTSKHNAISNTQTPSSGYKNHPKLHKLEWPVLEEDEWMAQHKIRTLMSDYPFTDTKQVVPPLQPDTDVQKTVFSRLKGADWLSTQRTLVEQYQQVGKFYEAAMAAGLLFDALPFEANAARAASLLYLRTNQLNYAHYYAFNAYKLSPNNANFGLSLAEILFKKGYKQDSNAVLDEIIAKHPNNQKAKQIKRMINS